MAATEKRVIQIEVDGSTGEISAKKLESALASIDRRLDPLGVATRKYGQDVAFVRAAQEAGLRTADQAAQRLTQLGAAYDATRRKIEGLAQAQTKANVASSSNKGAGVSGSSRDIDAQSASLVGFATKAGAVGLAIAGVAIAAKKMATEIATAGDEVRVLVARLNVVTGAADGSRVAFDSVVKVAQTAGVEIKDVGQVFAGLAIASRDFGATTNDIQKVSDTLLKLGRVGGASQEELTSGALQLRQALASGKLQGDELRSIMENMPLVARAIAKEFGVTTGELKKLGEEGKLVSDRVFKALINAGSDADAAFKRLPPTLEQAGVRGANAFKLLYSAIDDSLGVSKLLASGLNSTADRATELAARIRGDINLALADTIAKINELEGRAAKAKADRAAGAPDKPPGVPDSWVPDGRRPQQSLGVQGSPTQAPQTEETEIRRLEQLRREQERTAAEEAARQMRDYETDQENARRAKAESDARRKKEGDKLVGDLKGDYDKTAEKAQKLEAYQEKLNKAISLGALNDKQAAEMKKRYAASLDATGTGAKDAQEAIEALNKATAAADFAQKKADAAYQGAGVVARIEAEAEAASVALEKFKKRNASFESDFADQKMAERGAKLVETFRESTTELERGNRVLEAQVRLLDERPEVAAKEIAAIKVRNDLEAKGLTIGEEKGQVSQKDVDRQIAAAEAAELYAIKLDDAKKAQEAAAEPWKNATESLQSYAADVLTTLPKTWGEAADKISGIWKRLRAEILVASVIRPIIMQPVVSVLGSLGVVPQSVVNQYGGGILGGGGGGGGGLLSSLFGSGSTGGGGGGSSFLGDTFSFLSNPITNSVGDWSSLGAGMYGPPSPYAGALGGLTWGGALAGIGSIGMGAVNMAQGNMIGGISGILGGGLGLLGAISPALGFLGPVGLGIGLLGSVLSMAGLGKKKVETPQAVSNLSFGADGWTTAMAMSRGKGSLQTGTGKAGGAVGDIINQLTNLYGLGLGDGTTGGFLINSVGKHTGNLWQVGLGTYSNPMGLPSGFKNGGSDVTAQYTSAEDAAGALAAMIIRQGAMSGTLTGLTATQQTVLKADDVTTIDQIKAALDFSQVYDDLKAGSENVTDAEKAIRDLNTQFRSLSQQAKDYGLDAGIIEQRRQEAINQLAVDMNTDVRRRMLGMTPDGQLQLALEDADKARDAAIKNAEYINSQVTGTLVDINALEAQFGRERVQIIENANAAANDSLEELWRRLTYGDLSAASPLGTLEGTRSAYETALAAAQNGDLTARGNLSGFAEAYVTAGYQYQGSNADQAALVSQVAGDIAPFFTANQNLTTAVGSLIDSNTANNRTMTELLLSNQRLVEELTAERAVVTELLSRLNRAA